MGPRWVANDGTETPAKSASWEGGAHQSNEVQGTLAAAALVHVLEHLPEALGLQLPHQNLHFKTSVLKPDPFPIAACMRRIFTMRWECNQVMHPMGPGRPNGRRIAACLSVTVC